MLSWVMLQCLTRFWNNISDKFLDFKKWDLAYLIYVFSYHLCWPLILRSPSELIVRYFVGNKAKGRISKRTCAYQGARNVCFWENLACFVFLKHRFWDSPFCLITDDLTVSFPESSNQNLRDAKWCNVENG